MSPFLKEGDYILVGRRPFFRVKKADTVVFFKEPQGMMVKKVESCSQKELFVRGLHPDSIDSRHFGAILKTQVFGKMLMSFSP